MGASVSATVVFRRRDPTLITNDNLESTMAKITGFGRAPIKAEGSPLDYGPVTMTNISSGSIRDGGLRVHGRPVEIKPFEVYLDMETLNDKSSAYNVDPETLANLWVVRFGKDWVDAENIGAEDKEDIWWRHAANRLRELGYLEMHTLASSYRVVLRIVE